MGVPAKGAKVSRAPRRILGLGKEKSWASHHNSALSAKVELRRWLRSEVHRANGEEPMILDCFCAAGMLWEKAYEKTSRYLGLDLRQFDDERRTIVTDCTRFLRHVDVRLETFNLFDLDAFGSPFEPFAIICERLKLAPGRVVGFALTDGTGYAARMGNLPRGLLDYVGMQRHRSSQVQSMFRDQIMAMGIAKALRTAGLVEIERRGAKLDARQGAAEMRYIGILARKQS